MTELEQARHDLFCEVQDPILKELMILAFMGKEEWLRYRRLLRSMEMSKQTLAAMGY